MEESQHAELARRVGGRLELELVTVAPLAGAIETACGLPLTPNTTLHELADVDALVLPVGANGPLAADGASSERPRALASRARSTLSVCDGAWFLCAIGKLDGMEVTTNRDTLELLQRRLPAARVRAGVRFVEAGSDITTSDGTTGRDGALRLVERMLGRDAAITAANHLVYEWHPDEVAAPPQSTSSHTVPGVSQARRSYPATVEERDEESRADEVLRWLRASFAAGFETPSHRSREPALRGLLTTSAHARGCASSWRDTHASRWSRSCAPTSRVSAGRRI